MVNTYKNKFNNKYGFDKDESHTLEEISKITGYNLEGLQTIQRKGEGAYFSNRKSVRPHITSPIEWGRARVYSAVMGGKSAKIDKWHLIIEGKGKETKKQYELIYFDDSNDNKTKYTIKLLDLETNKTITRKFGAYDYGDYIYYSKTLGNVEANKKKENYIKRHSVNEEFTDPTAKSTLSMYILWNKKTLIASLKDYIKKFNIKF